MNDTIRCAATGRDTSRPGIYMHLAEGTVRVVSMSGETVIDAAAICPAATFPSGVMEALQPAIEAALHERAAADADLDLEEQSPRSGATEQLEAFGAEHDAEMAEQLEDADGTD